MNPLLASSGLPDYAAITAEHVGPAVETLLQNALVELEQLEANLQPTWAGSMQPLEHLDLPFEYAWKPVSHLFGVRNSPELRTAYETVLPDIVKFSLRVRQSEPIFRTLKQLRDGAEWVKLNPAQQRIVADRIKDAELAGIALPAARKERFNEIERELSQISTEFSNHVLDATKAFSLDLTTAEEVAGLTPSLKQLAAQAWNQAHADAGTPATADAGPWRITLEFPLYGPFMEHSQRRDLREQLYRAFMTRASQPPFDNTPLLTKFLELRQEKAKLLGFPHYAALSLARKMAPGVEAVQRMFEELRAASWDAAQRDLRDLKELKEATGDTTLLALWDIPFWSERLREQRFSYTDEEVRPYFPFEKVLQGLFDLLYRLFGIRVEEATAGVSVWNSDVRYYKVFDEAGTHIAGFYLDPYSRPENKRGGAWMDDCFGRKWIDGQLQLPVAHLVCNQTPPTGDKPSLMTFREVETLFHEFGHGLQHMLTTVNEADAAGINGVEWDAVELPSQFMENWCYHRPVLLGMTGHYQTGEPLPETLFERIRAARNYRSGSMMLRQLLFGMTDMELHSTFDPHGAESIWDLQRRLAEKSTVMPLLPEDRFLCSFSHIFAGGYSAGYYSYKWAEILSADAFSAFEEAGLDDEAAVQATGRRFRDTVLALGGSQHPLKIFESFRGHQPQVEPLLRHQGLVK